MGDKVTRKSCIQNNSPCPANFGISDNPKAKGDEPLIEISDFSQVNTFSATIDKVASEKHADAALSRRSCTWKQPMGITTRRWT